MPQRRAQVTGGHLALKRLPVAVLQPVTSRDDEPPAAAAAAPEQRSQVAVAAADLYDVVTATLFLKGADARDGRQTEERVTQVRRSHERRVVVEVELIHGAAPAPASRH